MTQDGYNSLEKKKTIIITVLDTGWCKHFCGTLILQTRIFFFLHFVGSRLYVGKREAFPFRR